MSSTDGKDVCNEVCQKQKNPLKDWLESNGYSDLFSSRFSDCSSAEIDFDATSDYYKESGNRFTYRLAPILFES